MINNCKEMTLIEIKTFDKAQEIFKNQANRSVNFRNFPPKGNQIRNRISEYTTNSKKLYNLYKYNKFFRAKIRYISNLCRKNIRSSLLNRFVLFSKLLVDLKCLVEKNSPISRSLERFLYSFKQFLNLSLLKSFKVNEIKPFSDQFTSKLRKFLFYFVFEYKVSFYIKKREYLDKLSGYLFRLFKRISKVNEFSSLITMVKKLIFRLKRLIEKLILRFNFSKEKTNQIWHNVIRRTGLITLMYYFPLYNLLAGLAFVLALPPDSTLFSGRQLPLFSDILSKYRILRAIESINRFKQLPFLNLLNFLSDSAIFVYFALFTRSQNVSKLSKEIINHGLYGLIYLIFGFSLRFVSLIFDLGMKSFILLIDNYFLDNLTRTRSIILFRKFRDIISSDYSVEMYKKMSRFSRLDNQTISVRLFGRYENLIQKLYIDCFKFVNGNILIPIYLIIICSLLYNCCYSIIYIKQPYIPTVSNLANKITPNIENN